MKRATQLESSYPIRTATCEWACGNCGEVWRDRIEAECCCTTYPASEKFEITQSGYGFVQREIDSVGAALRRLGGLLPRDRHANFYREMHKTLSRISGEIDALIEVAETERKEV